MRDAEQCSERLRALYGEDPARDRGVLHAVAVWRAPDGRLPVLAIGPGSPASETDAFALRAARMRAQAILTTGKILRDERDLRHVEHDAALLAWRRERAQLAAPPRSVVLTSGRELDLRHPLFEATPTPWIATDEARADALRERAAKRVDVRALPRASLRAWVRELTMNGLHTLLIEAGPASAAALYDEPVCVDELLLSVFEEPRREAPPIAAEFCSAARLTTLFTRQSSAVRVREASGLWSFQRLRR